MSLIGKLEAMKKFTLVEQEVVLYILKHKDQIINMNIADLAELTYTSNATIIRLCRKLGLSGYKEFKILLVQDLERRRKEQSHIDMSFPFYGQESSADVMKSIADLSKESIETCYETISSIHLEKVASWISKANNTYIYANGDSLISAISFSNRLIKLKKHTIIADQYGEGIANTYNVTSDDVALFVSYSGNNVLDQRFIKVLKKSGCKMILITSASNAQGFDIVIDFPDKETQEGKIATYYSQISINYILNCIYAIIFANDYTNNLKTKYTIDTSR